MVLVICFYDDKHLFYALHKIKATPYNQYLSYIMFILYEKGR